MAKSKKLVAGAPGGGDWAQAKLNLEPSDGTPTYYITYADVAYSANDFALTAVRVPAKLNTAQIEMAKSGTLILSADVQIIIPPTVIPGLIRALTTAKEGYEKLVNAPITDTGTST